MRRWVSLSVGGIVVAFLVVLYMQPPTTKVDPPGAPDLKPPAWIALRPYGTDPWTATSDTHSFRLTFERCGSGLFAVNDDFGGAFVRRVEICVLSGGRIKLRLDPGAVLFEGSYSYGELRLNGVGDRPVWSARAQLLFHPETEPSRRDPDQVVLADAIQRVRN